MALDPPPQDELAQSAAIASNAATPLHCNRLELAVTEGDFANKDLEIERLVIATNAMSTKPRYANGQPMPTSVEPERVDPGAPAANLAFRRLAAAAGALTVSFTGIVAGLFEAAIWSMAGETEHPGPTGVTAHANVAVPENAGEGVKPAVKFAG